jgi:hypothetical protein
MEERGLFFAYIKRICCVSLLLHWSYLEFRGCFWGVFLNCRVVSGAATVDTSVIPRRIMR